MAAISVIVVVRNGEAFVGEALQSVLAQTLPPLEIIVVDGQSSDHTVAIVQSFPGMTLIRQPDLGLANARNLGLAHAGGAFIAFLDHDDIWLPEKLARQVGYLLRHPHIQYTLTEMEFFGRGRAPAMIAAGTPSALVARRTLFDQIGLFDPQYAIGCDADWFTRARDAGVPAYTIPVALLRKRLHDRNLSVNGRLNRQEMFAIARRSAARSRQNSHDYDSSSH